MDIASAFDWFALDSLRAAEQIKERRERETLLKLALLWVAVARESRDEELTMQPS